MRTSATLLALGLLAAACASSDPSLTPGPRHAETRLGEPAITAIARALRMEDVRELDPDLLHELAGHRDHEVRRRALMAAGRIGDTAATPLILRALATDPDSGVRADAAFALGLLGDSSSAVLDGLAAAAPPGWTPPREDVEVTIEVLEALGKIGGERARALVEAALDATQSLDGPVQHRVAAQALLTIWRFTDRRSVQAAAPFLAAGDPEIRWRAAYALMRGGHPDALPHLLELGDDPEHRVRAYTARALTAEGADSAGVADRALDWLRSGLDDPHPHVRINAVRALAGYGQRAPLQNMAGRLSDPDPSVVLAAAGALAQLGTPAASALADAFQRYDSDQPTPAVAGALLEALAHVDSEAAAPIIAAWATAPGWRPYFAARAVPALEPTTALPIGRVLARHDDVRVASAALGAVAAIAAGAGEESPHLRDQARAVLRDGASADDPLLRSAGLLGFGPLSDSSDVGLLLDAIRRVPGRDPLPAERQSAIAALGALADLAGRTGSGLAIANRLFALSAPADPWIRAAAAEIGDGWGPAPRPEAGEDLAFYADVARRYVAATLAGEEPPRAHIRTPHGTIVVQLLAGEAPLTVHNFIRLAESGYFDRGVWHRVIPNFVLQDGAPAGQPSGGPGWSIRDEINRVRYDRGALGMALSGPDTGGSQWFITHSPQPHLDGGYTVFGRVIDGMDAATAVLQGEPLASIRIEW